MAPDGFSADRPEAIADALFYRRRRILVYGEPGSGKSTLVSGLSRCLFNAGIRHRILGADPGAPAFGIPGAVCLGRFESDAFRILDFEAICSLNAGRFRLPLMQAVARLTAGFSDPVLLVDGPGLTRGIAAAELLTGLVTSAGVDTLLLLIRKDGSAPLMDECNAAGIDVIRVISSSQARAPNARRRATARTALWNAHLAGYDIQRISLDTRALLGTPPANGNRQQWNGRQIALVEKQRTIAMGEVVSVEPDRLLARLPQQRTRSIPLLVRDAGRNANGELVTITPPQKSFFNRRVGLPGSPSDPLTVSPAVSINLGTLGVKLANGIFGDPLVHLHLPHQKRSLLFDLGNGSRLPVRIAHQVSDVFITHAHIDHIGGFFWLLRSRIGELPVCRLYGTLNLSRHIAGMIDGIHWDRIGNRGPSFDIVELDGDRQAYLHLQVGHGQKVPQKVWSKAENVLIDDPLFTVRAALLDHGIPVLALAYEEKPHCQVIEEALRQSGFPPGPWLGNLKKSVAAGDFGAAIQLPDGSTQPAARLSTDLIRMLPGRKLVYATDVADSPANRQKLIDLAQGADLFFCEAAYVHAHRHLAQANGHLTARACGEIAAAARVRHLVPFHLSRRYKNRPGRIFSEITQACQQIPMMLPIDS